eukprot:jgi/Hompol1/4980/HPOL_004063-RA
MGLPEDTFRIQFLRHIEAELVSNNKILPTIDCLKVIDKMLSNRLEFPDEQRFKIIRARNTVFKDKVRKLRGAEDALLMLGMSKKVVDFEEVFSLPGDEPEERRKLAIALAIVREYLLKLEARAAAPLPESKKSEEQKRREKVLMLIEEDRQSRDLEQQRREQRKAFRAQPQTPQTPQTPMLQIEDGSAEMATTAGPRIKAVAAAGSGMSRSPSASRLAPVGAKSLAPGKILPNSLSRTPSGGSMLLLPPDAVNEFSDEALVDCLIQQFSDFPFALRCQCLLRLLKCCDPSDMQYLGRVLPDLHRDFLALLPLSVSRQILTFVSPPDLAMCAKVSRSWHKVVSDEGLWKKLYGLIGLSSMAEVFFLPSNSVRANAKRLASLGRWAHGEFVFRSFKAHALGVLCIAFDGKFLATGSADRTCKMFLLKTGECLRTFAGHEEGVHAIQFDDEKVVTGSADSTVRIWSNKDSGALLHTLTGQTGTITCLKFTSSLLISGSEDKTIRIWSWRGTEASHDATAAPGMDIYSDVARPGNCIAILSINRTTLQTPITILDESGLQAQLAKRNATTRNSAQSKDPISSIDFKGQRLLISTLCGTILLFDMASHGMVPEGINQAYEHLKKWAMSLSTYQLNSRYNLKEAHFRTGTQSTGVSQPLPTSIGAGIGLSATNSEPESNALEQRLLAASPTAMIRGHAYVATGSRERSATTSARERSYSQSKILQSTGQTDQPLNPQPMTTPAPTTTSTAQAAGGTLPVVCSQWALFTRHDEWRLMCAGSDGQCTVWNHRTGKLIYKLNGPMVMSATNPTPHTFTPVLNPDATITSINSTTPQTENGRPSIPSLSSKYDALDSNTSSISKTLLQLKRTNTDQVRAITAVSFDESCIVAGSMDGHVKIWEANS